MSAARLAAVLSPSKIPQTEPVPGKPMVANNAGGFTFKLDDWARLDRFLILGSDKGTYYVGERKLTVDNAECVIRCVAADGAETVRRIVAVSDAGRAPKNSPAIFALALAAEHGNEATKQAAYAALPKVCRIGTHLFEFVAAKKLLGGAFGSGCRRAISRWYTEKKIDDLAYQLVKYRNRIGFTHRDVLRLARPANANVETGSLLRWATHGAAGMGEMVKGSTKDGSPPLRQYAGSDFLPEIVREFEALQANCAGKAAPKDVAKFLADRKLPWEAVPTDYLGHKEVWEALLPNLPLNATVRNLGRMTANGLLAPLSDASRMICERLRDAAYIAKSRLHPLAVLIAMKTYAQGRGDKGSLTWLPVPAVIDALNDAFYLAFGNVPKTGKRWLLALDVSGSMGSGGISGSPITPREASAAMALITAAVESETYIFGFSSRFVPLAIAPKMRLDDVVRVISGLPFEATDCAMPMVWAKAKGIKADCFAVYTDNETYAGVIHPFAALKEYRQATGINAKSAVVGMTATEFTIADPSDPGMCDFVGFDASTPTAMAAFAQM